MELILTTGLPRSGKSTFINKEYNKYIIIDIDKLRLELTDSIYNEDLEPYVWDIARDRVVSNLLKGNSVAIDECNTYLKNLVFWIRVRNFVPNVVIKLFSFLTSIDICLSRCTDDNLRNVITRKSKSGISDLLLKEFCDKYNIEYKRII